MIENSVHFQAGPRLHSECQKSVNYHGSVRLGVVSTVQPRRFPCRMTESTEKVQHREVDLLQGDLHTIQHP
jgi:hypothetical protein